MKDHTIKSIEVFKENKEGQPYKTKKGQPFARLRIKIEDTKYQDHITVFWYDLANIPQLGGTIMGEIKQEGEYQGKPQYQLELPKKENPLQKALEELANRATKLELRVSSLEAKLNPKKEAVPYPSGEPLEPNFDNPPF